MRLLDRLLWWRRPEARMEQAQRDQAVIDLHIQIHMSSDRAAKLADAFRKMSKDLRDEA